MQILHTTLLAPAHPQTYSFRARSKDLQLWFMPTELGPLQQASDIAMRLRGAARHIVRIIAPQELMIGVVVNKHQLKLVTYMLADVNSGLLSFMMIAGGLL